MGNNQLSRGTVEFNDFQQFATNKAIRSLTGSVTRTNTTAKTLGTIPANSIIVSVTVLSPVASNAATTAVLSVGKSGGTGAEYLNAFDVKGSAAGSYFTSGLAGSVGSSDVTVTGIYAETGTASTTGGPYSVYILYIPAN